MCDLTQQCVVILHMQGTESNPCHMHAKYQMKFSALIIFCALPSLPTLAQEPLRSYQVLLFLFHLDHMTSPGDATTDFSFFCTLFFQYAWFDSWPLKHFACFSTSNVSLFEFQESICQTYFLSLFLLLFWKFHIKTLVLMTY